MKSKFCYDNYKSWFVGHNTICSFFSLHLFSEYTFDVILSFSSSLSQTQLVGIGQPTRALLLLTLVVNGPTRARFSRLAHNLVKFPPAGNTQEKRKKESTTKLSIEWMCAHERGVQLVDAFYVSSFFFSCVLSKFSLGPTALYTERRHVSNVVVLVVVDGKTNVRI